MAKIDGINQKPTVISDRSQSERLERSGNKETGENRGTESKQTDSVTLTDTARLMQRIEKALADVPDVDQARVTELRDALASGRYQSDPQRIADQLLRLEREILKGN